jgi:phospholipase/lecithinase/hemolysin
VWVQDLSASLGLGPLAPDLAPPSVPNRTDFAVGGAQTGTTSLHAENKTDLPAQLTRFEQEVPAPQPDALYTISIGSNDLFAAIAAFPSNPIQAFTAMTDAAVNVDRFVADIAADGAQNILVLTVPDLGKTPAATAQGPTAAFTASALSSTFDRMLTTSLQSLAAVDHLKLDFVDGYGLLDSAVANPAAFGLTNVTDPVWTGNSMDPSSGILRATTPAAQDQFLFWDSVHPTASVHAIVGETAYQSLLATA